VAARIVVHGHFYQPPRENPWTGTIDVQPSAAPFHDWNERVNAECYRPNSSANVAMEDGVHVVNNFERLSFNVGPTLLSWMEKADNATYLRIVDADRKSERLLGHGNAIAQAYHHTILPLSTLWDMRTEVRWGLADFRHRFAREADGMWLPETAADDDTLRTLIEEGVRFTILAPWQAHRWREPGGQWNDVAVHGLDTGVPYRYLHPDGSGRSLALFFYDADIARAIAFEKAASAAERFMDLFTNRARDGVLSHAATDGETYGHHHVFGEIGLAYALFHEAERRGVEVSNYARELADHPPEREVEIVPGRGTSWSCSHGVERWASDCGCHTGGQPGWNQAWRGPLRAGFATLKGAVDDTFDRLGRKLFADPWGARDRYVDVLLGALSWDAFLEAEASSSLGRDASERAAVLLDLQRNAMSMFTSCGWFFSDVAGTESLQNLRYAARTVELLHILGEEAPAAALNAMLEKAESNDPSTGTGRDLLRAIVADPTAA
jgi:alpha-amylase/alpha-mannosidase (GH57 family)